MDKIISLIGLGVVGAPLANNLYKEYSDDFALLCSPDFLKTLTDNELFMNGETFAPNIISSKNQLSKKIGVVFICVKNYHISSTAKFLKEIIDNETIIFPLQNGVYSYDFFKKEFPNNIVLEGFAQGPNTQILGGCSFVYQKPGMFHIGSNNSNWKAAAANIFDIMKNALVEVYYDDDIRYQVWKKLMLNVAGNAITALTEIDYCMFKNSKEVQDIGRKTMNEFVDVANIQGVHLTTKDIEDIFKYYFSFKVSKRTSMLEDVTNKRPTENEFLAGYIRKLALDNNISTPYIDALYNLIKIKEDVYLKRI